MQKSKRTDKIIYAMILIMGIIGIAIISYFIIFGIMQLMNTSEFSKILIDIKIYPIFYDILNFVDAMAILLFVVAYFICIPYIINSIILGSIFIRKYKKFKGEKKRKIIKTVILCVIIMLTIIKGISIYPMTSQYEVTVNSKISVVSNVEVRKFLEDRIKADKYIYKVRISRGFPNDYNVKIYYKDIVNKVEHTFLAGEEAGFINTDAKELTNTLAIRSIIIMTLGDIVYVYFLVYILKEFKRISE